MSTTPLDPYDRDPRATGATAAGAPAGSTDSGRHTTTDTAKEQAAGVASEAGDAGKHVAGVAKEQAGDVIGEARRQASDLLDQGRTQLKEQSTAGQQRAATGLSALASELKDLAEGKGGNGIATDLAHQASQRVDAVGTWLSDREPADVLREVQSFARRRPVAFLAIAAGAGLVAGRLTRGLTAASQEGTGQERAADTASSSPQHSGAAGSSQQWTAPAPATANPDQARVTGTTDPVYGTTPTRGTLPGDATTGLGVRADQTWDGPLR